MKEIGNDKVLEGSLQIEVGTLEGDLEVEAVDQDVDPNVEVVSLEVDLMSDALLEADGVVEIIPLKVVMQNADDIMEEVVSEDIQKICLEEVLPVVGAVGEKLDQEVLVESRRPNP